MHRGLLLRLYLVMTHTVPLIAPWLLRRRLAKGKEDPARWREKLGQGLAPRPDGPLIWLNAVGLGEVLSVRGLIAQLSAANPKAQFLVTSTTAVSAQVFANNLPPRCIHQFLPIDAPAYRKRFLDHFHPNLCIWVEQDLWPGFVSDLARRDTPQAIVAARMDANSRDKHRKARSLYRDLFQTMAMITAQDEDSANNLCSLGAATPRVCGSLKPSAPALTHDPKTLAALRAALQGRTIWTVAPAHHEDTVIARAAHDILRQNDPTALLIIVPRFPQRLLAQDQKIKRRSKAQIPTPNDKIWLCDTFGELGLIYRLSLAALIGGTFNDTEGHNPWEAACLHTAILFGHRIANFKADFARLQAAGAATKVNTAADIAAALRSRHLSAQAEKARDLTQDAQDNTAALAKQLIQLLPGSDV